MGDHMLKYSWFVGKLILKLFHSNYLAILCGPQCKTWAFFNTCHPQIFMVAYTLIMLICLIIYHIGKPQNYRTKYNFYISLELCLDWVIELALPLDKRDFDQCSINPLNIKNISITFECNGNYGNCHCKPQTKVPSSPLTKAT